MSTETGGTYVATGGGSISVVVARGRGGMAVAGSRGGMAAGVGTEAQTTIGRPQAVSDRWRRRYVGIHNVVGSCGHG